MKLLKFEEFLAESAKSDYTSFINEAKKMKDPKKVNEGLLTIAGGVILGLLGLKLIKTIVKKTLGKIGMNLKIGPEKLKALVDKIFTETVSKGVSGNETMAMMLWKTEMMADIDSGEIKTINDILKSIENMDESAINEAYTLLNFFQEMQSFDAAGVTKKDIDRAKKSKKTDKNNKDLKGLLSDWSSGKYDEDPGYLVDELRDLLESVSIDEGKDIKVGAKGVDYNDTVVKILKIGKFKDLIKEWEKKMNLKAADMGLDTIGPNDKFYLGEITKDGEGGDKGDYAMYPVKYDMGEYWGLDPIKESVNEGKYSSSRDADDIFFLWDDFIDDDRQGIEHGNGSSGGKRYSQFIFNDDAKGFDDFEKKVEALMKKNKWEYDFDGDVLNIYESVNEAMDNYSDDAHTIADEFMSQYNKRDKVDLEEWEQFMYDTFIMNPGDAPQLDNEEIDKYTMDDILNILGDNRYNKVDMDEIGAAYESVENSLNK